MIRIEITDERGERHVIEAKGIDGGALAGEATASHKPIRSLRYGELTSSDRMSIIETMVARVAADELRRGADPQKLQDVFAFMVRNAFASVFNQPDRWSQYTRDNKPN